MQITKFIRQMGRNDARLVRRDVLMAGLMFYPVFMYALVRYAIPPLSDWLQADYNFDARPYYGLASAYMLGVMLPMFLGMVFGLLLVEEQDDRTLTAMMVTPVSLDLFVWYRISAAYGLALVGLLAFWPLVGIVDVPLWQVGVISLLAALNAPATGLILFSMARNKVQAFGVLKALSTLNVVPLVAWFTPEPWQFLFGLYPPYWAARLYWTAVESGLVWWYFVPGIVTYAGLIGWGILVFRQKAYSGAVG